MTLLIGEGFEGVRDDSDLRIRGWVTNTRGFTAGISSFSGVPGTALRLASRTTPYTVQTNNIGVAATTDFGWKPLGKTINQLWAAGGFVLGIGARFNPGIITKYSGTNSHQLIYDGSNYWAIQVSGTTASLVNSSDGINWSTVPTPVSVTAATSVFLVNVGTVGFAVPGSGTFYSTTNSGMTWTTTTLLVGGPSSFTINKAIASGNPTYPIVVNGSSTTVQADTGLWAGSLGSSAVTQLESLASTSLSFVSGTIDPTSTYIVYGIDRTLLGSQTIAYANPIATLGLLSLVTSEITAAGGVVVGYNYFPQANLWVAATNQGIFSAPNIGTTTIPVFPGNLTWTLRQTTGSVCTCFAMSPTRIVIGTSTSGILTSTDGITWAQVPGTNADVDPLINVVWTGVQFLATTSTLGWTLTSVDGLHWNVIATAELTENSSANINLSVTAIYGCNAINTTAGTLTAVTGVGILPANVSSGNRNLSIITSQSTLSLGPISATANAGYHYYQLVCTATAVGNTFNIGLFVDGVAVGGTATNQLLAASTTDTTLQAVVNLPRAGIFTTVDDLVVFTMDGEGVSTPLGSYNIIDWEPNTDVQNQWTKSGTQSSNAIAASATSAYNATGFVSSSVAGNKDIYTSASSIPNGYSVVALAVEAAMQAVTANGSVQVGVKSEAAETDSATVTLIAGAGNTLVQAIVDKDPNTAAPWTQAAIVDADITLTQIS